MTTNTNEQTQTVTPFQTFYDKWNEGERGYSNLGGFQTKLMELFRHADLDNREILTRAFPEYFTLDGAKRREEKIIFTDELTAHLISLADRRLNNFAKAPSKKITIGLQHELFMGAIAAIDFLNGEKINGASCLTPAHWVAILRGELIKP